MHCTTQVPYYIYPITLSLLLPHNDTTITPTHYLTDCQTIHVLGVPVCIIKAC